MKKKRKKRKMKRTDWEIKPHNKVINRIYRLSPKGLYRRTI